MLGKYKPEVLNKLHQAILDALKEFDRICRKYDITYFVGFGTAIGAARHQGFIPWDDDIDVCMMREEYEKLKQVPSFEWSSKYTLADPRDDYKFHRTLYPCIYIEGTTFETELHSKYLKESMGDNYPIHIDIFVFDYFKETKLKQMIKKTDNYKRLILYSRCKFKVVKSDSFKQKASCRIKRTLSELMRLTGNDTKKIYGKYLRYLDKNKGSFITGFELVETYEKYAFVSTYNEMFPVVYLPFEDMKVPMIKNYHEIMTKLYGDYLAMPPEEKRWNAAPVVLDFGDGRGNVIQKERVNHA